MTRFLKGLIAQGIRVKVPSKTQLLTTPSRIAANAEAIQVMSNSQITLTSTPTINDGMNGQIILVINVGEFSIGLRDQGILPNSNLRLVSNTVSLTPRDSICLLYLDTIGDWLQISRPVSVL